MALALNMLNDAYNMKDVWSPFGRQYLKEDISSRLKGIQEHSEITKPGEKVSRATEIE